MPLQATSGAASYDAFGGGVPVVPNYIEEVFQTQLWTGTGLGQTVNNGIDLAGKGGLVWMKARVASGFGTPYDSHIFEDTNRGAGPYLQSNSTAAEGGVGSTAWMASFNSNGYSFGDNMDVTSKTYVGWTFRKQPKFFDVVTYTGDGVDGRQISHNLTSEPGCIIVKRTDGVTQWRVYHRSIGSGANKNGRLNGTDGFDLTTTVYSPTSTYFTVSSDGDANASGGTYVAYLFAHNAGGFGLTGTDNVISCGSFTSDGSGNASVTLGYEPQFVLLKSSSATGNWNMFDTMRDMSFSNTRWLIANTSDAENSLGSRWMIPNATGFSATNGNLAVSTTYIYIAIRRPMKVPTSGTSVFGPNATSGTGANTTVTGGQTDDAVIIRNRGATIGDLFASRLTGTNYLDTTSTAAQVAAGTTILQANPWDVMDGVKVGTTSTITNASSNTFINYLFKRAPSFFDVVCYTGTGSNTTVSHNLGVAPDLIIVKRRDAIEGWQVYSSVMANTEYLLLNGTAAKATDATRWNSTTPTSSVFSVGTSTTTNASAGTYIAYLFSTCAGVSKVGSYAGTGTTIQVDCGFTSGARFFMIRRIDGSGNWWIWDTARGIVSGNDPYFKINNTDPEVANEDLVDPYSAGFEVSTGGAFFNASGFTYLFLAIA